MVWLSEGRRVRGIVHLVKKKSTGISCIFVGGEEKRIRTRYFPILQPPTPVINDQSFMLLYDIVNIL